MQILLKNVTEKRKYDAETKSSKTVNKRQKRKKMIRDELKRQLSM